MPAMTFWKNKLWLAWQATNNQVIVASTPTWNIGWGGFIPTFQLWNTSVGSGQGTLEWGSTQYGPVYCGQYQQYSYTQWTDGVNGGFTYLDAQGNAYQLGNVSGAEYFANSGCPAPTGPIPAGGLKLGPTGPNGNLTFTFHPTTGGSGYVTIP